MERLAALQRFMREVKVEAKKVAWPDFKETTQATLMVLVMVIFVSLFLWVADWSLSSLVRQVI